MDTKIKDQIQEENQQEIQQERAKKMLWVSKETYKTIKIISIMEETTIDNLLNMMISTYQNDWKIPPNLSENQQEKIQENQQENQVKISPRIVSKNLTDMPENIKEILKKNIENQEQ